VLALLFALAPALALFETSSAQQPRDPLIDPTSGGPGSRFQIVGRAGWVPGETVNLRVFFTTSADPLSASEGAPSAEFTVTVLADGTWSFPIVVDEFFAASGGPPDEPGYIVVRASAPSHEAVNAYIYTVRSVLPAGAEAIASAGFGPIAGPAHLGLMLALFAGGIGALLVVSGGLRCVYERQSRPHTSARSMVAP
jgi:hypothetical protein